jgi:LAS superfamily LD-carboxypeptidase LdcB
VNFNFETPASRLSLSSAPREDATGNFLRLAAATPSELTIANLKLHATELQQAARAEGWRLSRCAALEAVAQHHGWKNWNVALAVIKKEAAPSALYRHVLSRPMNNRIRANRR